MPPQRPEPDIMAAFHTSFKEGTEQSRIDISVFMKELGCYFQARGVSVPTQAQVRKVLHAHNIPVASINAGRGLERQWNWIEWNNSRDEMKYFTKGLKVHPLWFRDVYDMFCEPGAPASAMHCLNWEAFAEFIGWKFREWGVDDPFDRNNIVIQKLLHETNRIDIFKRSMVVVDKLKSSGITIKSTPREWDYLLYEHRLKMPWTEVISMLETAGKFDAVSRLNKVRSELKEKLEEHDSEDDIDIDALYMQPTMPKYEKSTKRTFTQAFPSNKDVEGATCTDTTQAPM